jgi:hypothetical protein
MVDIDRLELMYFQNDEPIPYYLKNSVDENGNMSTDGYKLLIKPIKVKDWSIFNNCIDILMHELQDYNSVEIIQMSYLEFIIDILLDKVSDEQISENAFKLSTVLSMALGIYEARKGMFRNKPCLTLHNENGDVVSLITPKEFNELKKIILFQNIINYDDRYLSPEIKKEIEEYEKIKYSNENIVNPTLEKQKVFVISKTGISMKDINDMTYRTFTQVYNYNVNVDLYFAQKILQASQKYDMKEDAIHPLFKKEEDRLKSAFVSKSEFEGKMKNVT